MTLRGPLIGIGAVSVLVALAALALLHAELRPLPALACAGLGLALSLGLRASWVDLPRFVAGWLDLGTAVVATLVIAATTGLSQGLEYGVFRLREITLLGGAAGFLGTALAGLAYTHRRLAVEVAAQARHLAASQQLALESRLSALSAQINPHFLFNTLNTLAEVIHQDEDRAEDLVTDLAAMMRYALRGSATRVPLTEELDVVRRLLRIEEARLGARLRWSVETEGALDGVEVPGLLVQPLVENAVQHGIATRPEGGTLTVRAVRAGDRVRVEVADDGPGLPDEIRAALADPTKARPGGGTGGAGGGLRNTAERARLAWPGGGARLSCAEGPGTRLVLELPVVARRPE